jgi:Mce-associated membrane protein
VLVAALALAGCGDDDGGDVDAASTEATDPTTTSSPATEEDVEAAAEDFVMALFDWDGATIDDDFDEVLTFATGTFQDEAQATFDDDATRQGLRESEASERVEDSQVHVESFDGDRATVFATVDVLAANNQLPSPRADTVRMEIRLVLVGGEWRVEQLTLLDGLSLNP